MSEPESAPSRALDGRGRARRAAGVDRVVLPARRFPLVAGRTDVGACSRFRSPKSTLANGLDVIVHEDHHAPLVAVSVWYHVGSKNEVPRPHGARASVRAPDVRGLRAPARAATSSRCRKPARRSTDRRAPIARTTGRSCPKDAARARAVDGSRPHGLAAAGAHRPSASTTQRERRPQRAAAELREPAVRPRAVRAARRDLSARSSVLTGRRSATRPICARRRVDDARAFFTRYYHPGNASLAIGGDIDDAGGDRSRAANCSARFAAGPPVAPVTPPPVTAAAARLVLEDRVELPRLYLAWPSPAALRRRRRRARSRGGFARQRPHVAAVSRG